MKLELKHIAPYLPYKLRVQYWDRNVQLNAASGSSTNWIGINALLQRQGEKQNCYPILRPMSDLIKPIKIKGYNKDFEFIPLEHLSKIAFPKNGIHEYSEDILRVKLGVNYSFYYNEYEKSFGCQVGYNGRGKWDYDCFVNNQKELFEALYMWHFDVDDLISKGLAQGYE